MILSYGTVDKIKWMEKVSGFLKSDLYYMPQYLLPFEKLGDGPPLLFYYDDDFGRAINTFHKRDIALSEKFAGALDKNQYFDIVSPYGYGGMLIETDEKDSSVFLSRLYDAYDSWCRENNIISEFTRFHPLLNNYNYLKDYYIPYSDRTVVYIDLSNGVEYSWKSLKDKNRNMIRKAENSGIKVHIGTPKERFNEFRSIYIHTMERINAGDYYYFNDDFYEVFLENFADNALIFAAEYEGRIVSASIILFHGDYMHYFLSGTYQDAMKLAPNNLILWEAARWGCENGKKRFLLGGGKTLSDDDPLLRFKSSFSRDGRAQAYQGLRIFDEPKYEYLVNLRIQRNCEYQFSQETDYLPKYRG